PLLFRGGAGGGAYSQTRRRAEAPHPNPSPEEEGLWRFHRKRNDSRTAGVSDALPIHAVLPALLAALRARSSAVLVAPPGAGKTTAVAPVLITEPWCTGQVLLLSPRRLAARAAAERMAELAGEPVGKTIGYATRLDSKHGPGTRILVLTEGIFRNRIQSDPELTGVSAVL